MQKPQKAHREVVTHLLRSISTTLDFGFFTLTQAHARLQPWSYTDPDTDTRSALGLPATSSLEARPWLLTTKLTLRLTKFKISTRLRVCLLKPAQGKRSRVFMCSADLPQTHNSLRVVREDLSNSIPSEDSLFLAPLHRFAWNLLF